MTTTLHTLPNGLTVLLESNNSAPVISFNVLIKVGSALEEDAEAGICHVIEHMLFKGTPTRPVGQIARDVEAAGGEINAYTSFDQTVYYINMATRFADQGLAILADAVRHPLFDAGELKREAEVICEEIRREEDNPSHKVTEQLFRHTYGNHPYGRPIIGFAHTVKAFTHEDLHNFWRKWYVPANMALIIVGDFEHETMLAKVSSAFGNSVQVPAPTSAPLNTPVTITGPQVFVEKTNIQSSYLSLGMPVPELTHADVPAIDILAHVLAGGESSRLEQEIKEKRQLVHGIYCYAFTPKGTGIFSIGAVLQSAKLQQTVSAIWSEIARIRHGGISVEELDRAKLNIRATELYEKESVGGQAGKYALFLGSAGDHTFERRYYQAVQETTLEQVRDVACRYLSPSRATLMLLAPKDDRLPSQETLAGACMTEQTATGTVSKRPVRPKAVTWRCQNGMSVIVRQMNNLPLVACCAASVGGLLCETRQNNGINALIAQTLTKGTKHRKAIEIAQTIDDLAGSIEGFAGRNSLGLRGEFLADKFAEGFSLFAEILAEPAFMPSEVRKEKRQQLDAIKNQEDNLPAVAMLEFCKALYGRHPYGMRQLGERATVKGLTPAKLSRYYHAMVQPQNLVLSISGDVDGANVRRLISRHLVLDRRKRLIRHPSPKLSVDRPVTVENKRADKQQAHIVYGFLTTTVNSPDYYPLTVLNYILAGQGGRLFTRLRDQMSLAYAVSSSHQAGLDPGYLIVYIGTEPAKVQTALSEIGKELSRMTEQRVDEVEHERSRQYLVGTYELDRQRNSSVASSYAFNVLYGLGMEEVERYPNKIMKVARDDILRVARKYLRPDHAVCSIIRPG